MNFSNFSKKFFKSYTGSSSKFRNMNVIKNNFRRAFLFNKVQVFNFQLLQTSSIIRNSLPFLAENAISNSDNIDLEVSIQNLLEGKITI
jgi:hypothetical protein